MLLNDPVIVTQPHYTKLQQILDSPLYEVFKHMPKPAIHHTHLTATADKAFLLKFTYHDYVYYSEKKNEFWVNQKKSPPADFLSMNTLRAYSRDSVKFDKDFMDKILLHAVAKEDHQIWAEFEPKFMMTFQLYNYKKFF